MEWIFKLIQPIIKDCETPEEAEAKVVEWGKSQHPRDASLGLIAVQLMNAKWQELKNNPPKQ